MTSIDEIGLADFTNKENWKVQVIINGVQWRHITSLHLKEGYEDLS